MENTSPLWTQDQAIAYEAALEAINDVIAGYSAEIEQARTASPPDLNRVEWLRMHKKQARAIGHSLNLTDDASVAEVLREFSAMVLARNAAAPGIKAA